jgi:hypothetical protein
MDLKEFEYKKLLKDVKYWKEEYELKKDMIFSIENMFNNALLEFLEKNPSIKSKWDDFLGKKAKQIEDMLKQKYSEVETKVNSEPISDIPEEKIEFTERKELSPKEKEIKRIYREIVKLTHPDKLYNHTEADKEKRLKIYKEATVYYRNSDLSNIIYYADELGIKYDISIIDVEIIKKDIEIFKQKANMYENSIYWKWYNENKNESLLNIFLNQQMSF